MNQQRILHVITTVNRGGAENHLVDLVKSQIDSGYDVAVAYLKGDSYWKAPLKSFGAKVYPLDLRYYGQISPLLRLKACLKEFRPDLVHAHMPPAELYTVLALLGEKKNLPLIISKHVDGPFYHGPLQRTVARLVASRATHLISISEAVAHFVQKELALPASEVTAIHYGIDLAAYQAVPSQAVEKLKAEWNVPKDAWLIGTVARLTEQKDLPTLLRAYARYCERAKRPSRLVLVGRGHSEDSLKELATTLNIAGSIIWAGFREDIPVVMKTFDCFTLTSIYEGFGLVLLEAMAAARPIVATKISAIPEVVADGESGILCPIGGHEAISGAFLQMENPEVRLRMGNAGQKRAEAHFTLQQMVQKTLAIYKGAGLCPT